MPEIAGGTSSRLAPAKVNLCLHVGRVEANGYHPIKSLVAFANIGDNVCLTERRGLRLSGPFSDGLSPGEDNLILRAVRMFERHTAISIRHGVHLDKQLPLASGIGGGSADAGAVFHLLRQSYAPNLSDEALAAMAGELGADGVMCLWNRSAWAEGRGERLSSVNVCDLPCVLVNPLVECSTPLIFKMFDESFADCSVEDVPAYDVKRLDLSTFDNCLSVLRDVRNDLQPAAIRLKPVIGDLLASLEDQPQTRLSRMSGSGATCFALCETDEDAFALSVKMQALWPQSWVRACRLGDGTNK